MAARSLITTNDLPLGAHQSIAGGTPRAVERGLAVGCRVLQVFVKNNTRWVGKEIDDAEARQFRRAAKAADFSHLAAHTSYLINPASPFRELRRQSIEALADEIRRCARLGIGELVLHPGSHGGEGEPAGIVRIAASLDEALERAGTNRVRLLLETAAGQGAAVGYRFEHLRDIFAASRHPRRLGVCLDTCHVHAAGYDLVSAEGYAEMIASLDRAVGLARLAAIHVNDSKKPRGSRVDRHEHIGKGTIGRAGFRNLMTDPRLAAIPKFLETPKDDTLSLDRRNLGVLRRLAGSSFIQKRSSRGWCWMGLHDLPGGKNPSSSQTIPVVSIRNRKKRLRRVASLTQHSVSHSLLSANETPLSDPERTKRHRHPRSRGIMLAGRRGKTC